MDGWTQSDGWNSVNGMLVNDGSDYNIDGHPTAIAPSLPQGVTNYSVQADIRLDRYTDQGGLASFGVVVRSPDNVGGYKIGVCAGTGIFACDTSGSGYDLRLSNDSFSQGEPVKQSPFHPTLGTWYTYRIDVQGNTITIWLGGAKIFSITDDKYLSAGSVGLWSDRCQISVRNFKITAL